MCHFFVLELTEPQSGPSASELQDLSTTAPVEPQPSTSRVTGPAELQQTVARVTGPAEPQPATQTSKRAREPER